MLYFSRKSFFCPAVPLTSHVISFQFSKFEHRCAFSFSTLQRRSTALILSSCFFLFLPLCDFQSSLLFILIILVYFHILLTIALITSELVYRPVGIPSGWYTVRLVYRPVGIPSGWYLVRLVYNPHSRFSTSLNYFEFAA